MLSNKSPSIPLCEREIMIPLFFKEGLGEISSTLLKKEELRGFSKRELTGYLFILLFYYS